MSDKKTLATEFPDIAKEWHPTKNGDITPSDVTPKSKTKCWWIGSCGHEWETQVYVRTTNHGCPYCAGKKVLPGFNDLSTIIPKLADEWHPTKNGDLKPTMVAPASNKKVWWLGRCGHEWQSTIDRRKRGDGCPICAKELQTSFPEQAIYYYVKKYFDDAINNDRSVIGSELDIYIPSIRTAIEYDGLNWHKNNTFEKDKNSFCSKKDIKLIRIREEGLKLYDDCLCIVRNNCKNNSSLCSAIIQTLAILDSHLEPDVDVDRDYIDIYEMFIKNEKDKSLQVVYPDIAKEWHPTKNGRVSPYMVSPNSNKRVWWLGKCSHEWQATVASRTIGNGCPVCSGKQVLVGENDLLSINPLLAGEWHPTKNGDLLPNMVTPNSHKKVWWLGKCGHEWQATIAHRSNGRDCPVCSNRKVLKGYNDLKTTDPDLATEWHPKKNQGLTPEMFTQKSKKKVWWLGECGHEWQASIKNRSNGTSCPICSNHQVLTGYNDLETIAPDIAKEWHPTKNGILKPSEVSRSSAKKVWWLGSCGHEWQAKVYLRTSSHGCPYCSNKKILSGLNDLETVNPALAAEWHPTKNGDLLASQVAPKSSKKVWWLCKNGHEWQASIDDRARGTGCPKCRNDK